LIGEAIFSASQYAESVVFTGLTPLGEVIIDRLPNESGA
jgi:hypothetical protein